MEGTEGAYYSSNGKSKKWVIEILTQPMVKQEAYMETLNSSLETEKGIEVLWCIHELQWNFANAVKWIGSYRVYPMEDRGWGFTRARLFPGLDGHCSECGRDTEDFRGVKEGEYCLKCGKKMEFTCWQCSAKKQEGPTQENESADPSMKDITTVADKASGGNDNGR